MIAEEKRSHCILSETQNSFTLDTLFSVSVVLSWIIDE